MATPKIPPTLAARASALKTLAAGKLFNTVPGAGGAPSKIGMPAGPLNRNLAQAPEPQATTGAAAARMSATTYFTQAPSGGQQSSIIYEADRLWARVTLILETAGPVAVGFSSNLGPVTSGKGILLTTDQPVVMDISKGNKLYIQATGANRVKLIVQSVPWLEQIAGLLTVFGKHLGVIQ